MNDDETDKMLDDIISHGEKQKLIDSNGYVTNSPPKTRYEDDLTRKLDIKLYSVPVDYVKQSETINFWLIIAWTMMTVGAFLGCVAWI